MSNQQSTCTSAVTICILKSSISGTYIEEAYACDSPASYLERVGVHAIHQCYKDFQYALFIVHLVNLHCRNHNSGPVGVVFT